MAGQYTEQAGRYFTMYCAYISLTVGAPLLIRGGGKVECCRHTILIKILYNRPIHTLYNNYRGIWVGADISLEVQDD